MKWFSEVEASSLVETMIALAIFITVVVPLSLMLTYLVTQKRAEFDMKALQLAREEMENVLLNGHYTPAERLTPDQSWYIQRKVVAFGEMVQIRVVVGLMSEKEVRKGRVILETIRPNPKFLPLNDEPN